MEVINENNPQNQNEDMWKNWEEKSRRGKVIGGIVLVIAGSLFFARELGAQIPHWIFSWKMLLIAIGIVSGVKHKFRNWGFLIPLFIGGIFLISDLNPDLHIKPFIIPSLVILIGLAFIIKPSRKHSSRNCKNWKKHSKYKEWAQYVDTNPGSSEDKIESVTVMGSVKKNILSKNFKGGEIVVVFGGGEINLSQADFQDKVSLEVVQVFGGTRLIIPANWEIQSEAVCVFGNIEDKRPTANLVHTEPRKILILRGTVFMGGIDIKSY